MQQCSAWSARWQSCAQIAEISRTVSSEVRGGRCFLQFCADLLRELEEQTICLTCSHSRNGFCRRMSAPDSYTNSVPRWCTTGRGACPSRTSVGSQMACRAPQCATAYARTRPAGNAGMLATFESHE